MASEAASMLRESLKPSHAIGDEDRLRDHDRIAKLSSRGERSASSGGLNPAFKAMLANPYDALSNPDGIINAGVADNSLCRADLLEYFLTDKRLELTAADMTYADRYTSSKRLLHAICTLMNERQPDWPDKNLSPLPLRKVQPDHLSIASGATGILDQLFWNICEPGDGVLVSVPYYNAFDKDLTSRAGAKIIEVAVPLPEEGRESDSSLSLVSFAEQTVEAYEAAYKRAQTEGIKTRALLLCNPHNPTGTIYPRETLVELARFAAKHGLHFVSDEIYARSTFSTPQVPNPPLFHSILSIDTLEECGLDPSSVHVVTSASKDFALNGFRLGVLVSQSNPKLQQAMSAVGLLSQSASPAASLWATLLDDTKFLSWYFPENRRRLAAASDEAVRFFKQRQIAFYPSNAGFFLMINLGRFCGIEPQMSEERARVREMRFVARMLAKGVLVSPGTNYHHPKAGWFRFTFSQEPETLRLALRRLDAAMTQDDKSSCRDVSNP